MKLAIRKRHYTWMILTIISAYFILNFVTILSFPFVHSDETWLMGLSRQALQMKSFNVTEPFFDLYPRTVHGLRLIFIFIQGIAIQIFGFKIWSVRLISLMAATGSLILIAKIIKRQYSESYAILITLLYASSLQFIMHSKMARQEALIILILCLAFYFYLSKRSSFLVALVVGLSISIHPNSFLVGCGIGCIYLKDAFIDKKIKELVIYIFTLLSFASLFILISYLLNPNFISEYMAYGETQGVTNFEISRIKGFYYFFYKIYHQIGGTYLLVNNKLNMIMILFTFVATSIQLIFKKIKRENKSFLINSYLVFIGIHLGLIIIGRYNQTSYIFTLVSGLLLISAYFYNWSKAGFILLFLVLILQCSNTYDTLSYQDNSYKELEAHFEVIPDDAKVLSNISFLDFLPKQSLYDYRNLWNLSGEEVLEYLKAREIDYIVWTEEMDYIHDIELWDILYGPMIYYETLSTYLKQQEIVESFESPTYGIRISKYVDTYPWQIKIYKIIP